MSVVQRTPWSACIGRSACNEPDPAPLTPATARTCVRSHPDLDAVDKPCNYLCVRVLTLTSLLCAEILSATSVKAQAVDEGAEHYYAARFEDAKAVFEAVLAMPNLQRADAINAHRFLALLALGENNAELAARHASIAVALDPRSTPPEGSPPNAFRLFDEARNRLAGREARVALSLNPATPQRDAPVTVRATLEPTIVGLASRLRLRCEAQGTRRVRESTTGQVELIVSAQHSAAADCMGQALSPGGAALLEASTQWTTPTEPVNSAAEDATDTSPPWAWIGVGAAVLVAAVSIVAVVLATSAATQPVQFSPPVVEGP